MTEPLTTLAAAAMLVWEDADLIRTEIGVLADLWREKPATYAVGCMLALYRGGALTEEERAAVPAAIRMAEQSDIAHEKVITQDGERLGYLMPFVNALMQARDLFFTPDGKWYCRPNNRSKFRRVGVSEVMPKDRARMLWHIIAKATGSCL